jgi:sugar/nucleoside kinase (ribokinase family)
VSPSRADSKALRTTPDFVVCGHAVQDLLDGAEDGWRLGGAVAYASLLATKLGLKAAVLTAAGPEMEFERLLPGIDVVVVASEKSTQMRNVYEGGRRRQEMPQRAAQIAEDSIPEAWLSAPIVLLGPVAGEVDDALAACWSGSLVGAGAQGWLRETGADTRVHAKAPESWRAEGILRHVDALFLSDEDVPADAAKAALARWSSMVETVAFTRGDAGADVSHKGAWRHIDAFPAAPLDRTGAGDVFASAFLVRMRETGDAWEATRFASCAASFVVEGEGVTSVPDREMIEERMSAHPEVLAK